MSINIYEFVGSPDKCLAELPDGSGMATVELYTAEESADTIWRVAYEGLLLGRHDAPVGELLFTIINEEGHTALEGEDYDDEM